MNSFDPIIRRQELGEELRMLRNHAHFSLREAAAILHVSESKISRMETGHRSASTEDVASLLSIYRADDKKRAHLLALARAADEVGWLQALGRTSRNTSKR